LKDKKLKDINYRSKENGESALQIVVCNTAETDLPEYMIEQLGAEINTKDKNNMTVFMRCCEEGYET
jgi:cellulose synthase/poly-beta-1,6-N-acetylglucosamine synthase-like glycosyltransferase